ncbi:Reverse transcriptase (RNA-dependent DNA polymerase) [Popillia japonica]|uniref:Reverse transcriptase (RNA-dependent DNA polymerase) n=1 Tax=Popillia japonica TaxID=7064 RepID=A0AAW1LS08_POPJA
MTEKNAVHSIHTVSSIETFDTSKKINRWLMRLESAFNVFAVAPNKKAAYLLHYMSPDAYNVLCDKISPENPDTKTYEQLVNTMKLHYNPEPLEIAENFRFIQRKQHEGDSARVYLTALQKMATTCKFGDYLKKKALRNQFVFGLRTQNIQSRLLEQKELDIEKAVDIAVSMETSARDAAHLHRSNIANIHSVGNSKVQPRQQSAVPGGVQRPYVKQNVIDTEGSIKCFRCGSDKHLATTCNKQNLICSKCKRKGHLSRVHEITCNKQNLICSKCKRKGHLSRVCMKFKNTDRIDQVDEVLSIQSDHTQYRKKFTLALQVNQWKTNLDHLEKEGVLEEVNSSEYATPIVPIVTANGNIRICGVFKCTLNPNLIVDEYPLPTIELLFSSMAEGDKFSKLDLQQAYLQIEVRPEDKKYLTLSTPKGLYRSTRLVYGIASAPAIWQREFKNILKDIPGVSVFLDDIKITGPDDSTHLKRLEEVLGRLANYNIRANYDKCQFFAEQIEYGGYIIDKFGIHKTKEKMDAIQNAKVPSNKPEVRAFVRLINYYGLF